MAEIRVKETGTIKLFESDNTSSVTIASPASLGADRTITLPDGDVTLATGTMPVLTGSTNNTVTTVTAANAISGEANLQFDGTDLTVSTGNVVIGTAGKGIDFSAQTPASGMTAELLDHYEEGTWTATFTTQSGSVTINTSFDLGMYTKIGRMVHVHGYFKVSSVSAPSGYWLINGLPFANNNSDIEGETYSVFPVIINGLSGDLEGIGIGQNERNTTYFEVKDQSSNTASNQIADHVVADTAIYISGTYSTD